MPEYEQELVSQWKAEPLLNRLDVCRRMLLLHGVLTAAENVKVRERLVKLASKQKEKR